MTAGLGVEGYEGNGMVRERELGIDELRKWIILTPSIQPNLELVSLVAARRGRIPANDANILRLHGSGARRF